MVSLHLFDESRKDQWCSRNEFRTDSAYGAHSQGQNSPTQRCTRFTHGSPESKPLCTRGEALCGAEHDTRIIHIRRLVITNEAHHVCIATRSCRSSFGGPTISQVLTWCSPFYHIHKPDRPRHSYRARSAYTAEHCLPTEMPILYLVRHPYSSKTSDFSMRPSVPPCFGYLVVKVIVNDTYFFAII